MRTRSPGPLDEGGGYAHRKQARGEIVGGPSTASNHGLAMRDGAESECMHSNRDLVTRQKELEPLLVEAEASLDLL